MAPEQQVTKMSADPTTIIAALVSVLIRTSAMCCSWARFDWRLRNGLRRYVWRVPLDQVVVEQFGGVGHDCEHIGGRRRIPDATTAGMPLGGPGLRGAINLVEAWTFWKCHGLQRSRRGLFSLALLDKRTPCHPGA
jgi:hypothetical protein